MPKITSMVDLLEVALKAESLRQKTIASNMANMETPGYRRLDVRFEELLDKALRSDGAADLEEIEPEIYLPKNTPVRANGNDVEMEAEVGELVKNSLRHTAYTRLLHKKLLQVETAINIRE